MAVSKTFLAILFSNLSRQVAFFVVSAVIFDRLSRDVFGEVTLAFSYMVVVAAFGEFGIRVTAWREISRFPEEAATLAGEHLIAKCATTGVVFLMWVVLTPVLWPQGVHWEIYLLFGLGILVNGSTFDFVFLGLDWMEVSAVWSAVCFGLYLLICITAVRGDQDAFVVPLAFVLSMVVLFFLQLLSLRRRGLILTLGLTRAQFYAILQSSWPLGVGEALQRLYLAYPVMMVGALLSLPDVAAFRIAEIGFSFVAQFGAIGSAAIFGRVAAAYGRKGIFNLRPHIRALLSFVIIVIAASLCFAVIGPFVLQLVYGDVEPSAVAVLRVLGFCLIVSLPTRFLRGLVAGVDQQRSLVVVNLIGLIVGLGVSALFIVKYGVIGAAYAVVVAEIACLGYLVLVLRGVVSV